MLFAYRQGMLYSFKGTKLIGVDGGEYYNIFALGEKDKKQNKTQKMR